MKLVSGVAGGVHEHVMWLVGLRQFSVQSRRDNLAEVIGDLIDDVGIDAWHSFQDVILPVTKAKEAYGDRVAVLGGVDMDLLSRASAAEVKAATKKILKACMEGGGYALGSGNSIPNYVRVENYLAMLEVGRKFGAYIGLI